MSGYEHGRNNSIVTVVLCFVLLGRVVTKLRLGGRGNFTFMSHTFLVIVKMVKICVHLRNIAKLKQVYRYHFFGPM